MHDSNSCNFLNLRTRPQWVKGGLAGLDFLKWLLG